MDATDGDATDGDATDGDASEGDATDGDAKTCEWEEVVASEDEIVLLDETAEEEGAMSSVDDSPGCKHSLFMTSVFLIDFSL